MATKTDPYTGFAREVANALIENYQADIAYTWKEEAITQRPPAQTQEMV